MWLGIELGIGWQSSSIVCRRAPSRHYRKRAFTRIWDTTPHNIDAVAEHCPWIAHSLATGGTDNDNRLRRAANCISAACDDPEGTGWRLQGNRTTLDPGEYDDQIGRAIGDCISNPKLSYTGCEKINSAQCKTCPHLSKGLNPLRIAREEAAAARLNSAPPTQPPQASNVIRPAKFAAFGTDAAGAPDAKADCAFLDFWEGLPVQPFPSGQLTPPRTRGVGRLQGSHARRGASCRGYVAYRGNHRRNRPSQPDQNDAEHRLGSDAAHNNLSPCNLAR